MFSNMLNSGFLMTQHICLRCRLMQYQNTYFLLAVGLWANGKMRGIKIVFDLYNQNGKNVFSDRYLRNPFQCGSAEGKLGEINLSIFSLDASFVCVLFLCFKPVLSGTGKVKCRVLTLA